MARHVFMDDDPAMALVQMLSSLQSYAKAMGIDFEAACEGDEEKLWIEADGAPARPSA